MNLKITVNFRLFYREIMVLPGEFGVQDVLSQGLEKLQNAT